ncbi:hypothetical protein L6164_008639 [Bauhinia variegata]|uniref:Uncharacterized protein n=1 Tax=Bauhinia variegata TaxID=167791 RepID=A0ACB9PGD0_BAUVA|nr:hypothetical protein L6164_008639 [Bauhinia variegata]
MEAGAAQKFKDLTLYDGHSSSSTLSSPSPSLIPLSPKKDFPQNVKTGNPIETITGDVSKDGRNIDKDKQQEIKTKPSRSASKGYSIPPPISCLRKVNDGEPYSYVRFDGETDSYVVEEIKVPNQSLFRASRENGSLKLYLDLVDEDEKEKGGGK